MNQNSETLSDASNVDGKWKGLYSASGIMLVAAAVVWGVVSWTARVLYASGYPTDPLGYLQLLSHHQLLASLTWVLWIVADFLLLAPTVALYLVLERYNRTLALFGSLFAMFFNVYDVCVTELNSLALVNLAHQLAVGASGPFKQSLAAAAAYGYYSLPIQTVLSFAVGSLGYLLWCIPMLKGPFRRWTTIYGLVMSAIGIIGSAAPLVSSSFVLALCQFLCVPGLGLWFVFVGARLYNLGKHPQAGPAMAPYRSAS